MEKIAELHGFLYLPISP